MGNKQESSQLLQVEISREKLALLFESGLICAAEIRCLTAYSKQQVSDLCLSSCAKKIGCNISLFDEFATAQPISLKNQVKLMRKAI